LPEPELPLITTSVDVAEPIDSSANMAAIVASGAVPADADPAAIRTIVASAATGAQPVAASR